MTEPFAVIVVRLEVWIKTVLDELKRINFDQEQIRRSIEKSYDELNERKIKHETDLQNLVAESKKCHVRFRQIRDVLKDHGHRIPSEREIEEQKEQKEKVWSVAGRVKYIMGWLAGVIFVLAVLKYLGKL